MLDEKEIGQKHTCPKADASKQCGCDEAIKAERNGRHSIDDGEDVIVLKRAHARLMVGLVQCPARLKIMPQSSVCPPRPHLHANLSQETSQSLVYSSNAPAGHQQQGPIV